MPAHDGPWLVGCGRADVTGEPWDAGMLGYGMRWQRTRGLHLRQWSRAFLLADAAAPEQRVVVVVADIGMFFANVREAVLQRLARTGLRPEQVLLTATHTHAGPGGFSGYRMYATTNGGVRQHTLQALVDGVVASVEQALSDAAPGRVVLSRGELHGASVNRSPGAFARNAEADRRHFPGGVDPATTLLRLERGGRVVGLVNWFATHGTSLGNRNRLISGDNKGYAAHAWEATADSPVVAAFAQTNAGDLSPNVPDAVRGPTADDVENTAVIGGLQLEAARALAAEPGEELLPRVDLRLSYVDLAGLRVAPAFTSDGRPHRTGRAVLGAAFAAGTEEGPGVAAFEEGVEGNRLLSACSALAFRLRPQVGDAQSPKAMLLPAGALGWTADRVPVHLVRLGRLVLVGLAQEVTVVAGLHLRRAVADRLEVPVEDVLVQGYANDYAGYVTTPEEYDAQRYEGGHTMFGRWELAAYLQEVSRVAADLRDDRPTDSAGPPRGGKRAATATPADPDPAAVCTGVRTQPPPTAAPGDVVQAEFAGDDPRGPARASYLLVERLDDDGWTVVADDTAWSTTVRWRREQDDVFVATVTWRVPAGTSGTHRLSYVDRTGAVTPSRAVQIG